MGKAQKAAAQEMAEAAEKAVKQVRVPAQRRAARKGTAE